MEIIKSPTVVRMEWILTKEALQYLRPIQIVEHIAAELTYVWKEQYRYLKNVSIHQNYDIDDSATLTLYFSKDTND